jgi:RNA polymerase sigma factor (TIGR02999 family)
MGDVTLLISQAREGDSEALGRLFELLYPELRRIAHARLGGHVRDGALDTTALVHECYLKFAQASRLTPEDRLHFLAYAATAMRSIIVDAARANLAQRRGGDAEHVTLNTNVAQAVASPESEILDVHAALDDLAKLDARLARVVEMRYFGGMKDEDIAQALGLTDRTVRRDWEKARLLLANVLRS